MAVIREGGTDPGSQRGRKGGTKGITNPVYDLCMILALSLLYM